jgi:hypothetical protein
MALARLVVCEKSGRWAVALRRELASRPLRVYESRSLADCRRELEVSPASVVALEVSTANAAALGEWIERASREFPQARFVVIGARDAVEWEWWMREAGAIAAEFSPRRLGPIVRLARRHLAAAPEEVLTFGEAVRRRMPWRSADRAGNEHD